MQTKERFIDELLAEDASRVRTDDGFVSGGIRFVAMPKVDGSEGWQCVEATPVGMHSYWDQRAAREAFAKSEALHRELFADNP